MFKPNLKKLRVLKYDCLVENEKRNKAKNGESNKCLKFNLCSALIYLYCFFFVVLSAKLVDYVKLCSFIIENVCLFLSFCIFFVIKKKKLGRI